MSHQILIPDDTYQTIVALAADRGQSPEALAAHLLQQQVDAEWEAACAKYDDLTSSLQWQAMEDQADAELAAGMGDFYESEEALEQAFSDHDQA